MDLRGQLAVVRSWFVVIAAAAVLAGVAGYLVSGVLPKLYEAHAKVRVIPTDTAAQTVDTSQKLSDTYAKIATTTDFIQGVMTRLGVKDLSVKQFQDKVSVKGDPNLPFIEIIVTDLDAGNTAKIAQAMVDELIATSGKVSGGTATANDFLERQLRTIGNQIDVTVAKINLIEAQSRPTPAEETQLRTLWADLADLRQTYGTFRSFTSLPANQIVEIEHPATPLDPSSPRPLFNTAISVLLGLLVATGFAFVWEKFDDRVKTPEDVERVTGLPTIGTILRMPSERGRKEIYRLATLLNPRSVVAEAFRTIRTNLEFASVDRPLRTITVTSSLPGEGKSVVSANLAVAFGQAGRRTILVDADLRRPGIHTLFSLPNETGLTDMVLSDAVSLADVAMDTEEPNLRILTSGPVPANPAELLGSQRMAVILQRILAEADLVILDTAPVGVVTDAALVAARTDSTLLVVSPDRSSERIVRKVREALAHVNARVVGVVLNNVAPRDAQSNPYYGLYRPDERSKTSRSDKSSRSTATPDPRPSAGTSAEARADRSPTAAGPAEWKP
ncbi:MAG: polysaccharide biosynthesis tyrosine autokinase [Chloroflexota bacterium]|nr:polysaccharide biosynthesis tyrosine autokinase [Chloroflexota bacterium]